MWFSVRCQNLNSLCCHIHMSCCLINGLEVLVSVFLRVISQAGILSQINLWHGGSSQTWQHAWTKHITKGSANSAIRQRRLRIFRMIAKAMTLHGIWGPIIAVQLWHWLLGTDSTEASLTRNQNKTILARVPKVMEVTVIDMGYTLYIQDFSYSFYFLM